MADLAVLHVVPRWHEGGPTTGVTLEAAHARRDAGGIVHRAIALEPGASSAMLRKALGAGLRVHFAPGPDEEETLLAAADVVVVHWWNAPSVRRFFDRHRGRGLRWIASVHVNGMHRPQRIPPAFGASASAVLLTSPHGREALEAAARAAGRTRAGVHLVPAIARLDAPPGCLDEDPSRAVVHVGTLNVFKLSPAFVPLHARAATPARPVVVGGAGGDEERFRAEAAELGIGDGFRWTGFVADVPAFFAGARLLSYPGSAFSYASSDRVVQEAQACGVPVLMRRDSPLVHLVREGVTGILADGDEDFALLVEAAAAGDLALPPRRLVREAALEDHDPVRKHRLLDGVYREVAEGAPGTLDDGFGDLRSWMEFQVGDPGGLVDARRPSLAALRGHDVLERHQRWACEGGLAHYRKAFGEEADL